MNKYRFYHALYGMCVLLANTRFLKSTLPTSVCYYIEDDPHESVRDSSILDIGHSFPPEVLVEYGYVLDDTVENIAWHP